MVTILLIILPLIAGLILFFLKNEKRVMMLALTACLAELIVLIYCLFHFSPSGGIQFAMQQYWIYSPDVRFSIGLDGISITMVLLTSLIVPLVILTGFRRQVRNPGAFYGLILLMQSAMVGVFTSFNAVLFYVFWELALIPMYFIILLWGGENRKSITLKFFIYTLSGSLLMLTGFIYIYLSAAGSHSFELSGFYHHSIDRGTQSWLFWLLLAGFAVKMPLFPFHTWQPDTYTVAPAQGSMLLAALMSKMGIYGAMRWLIPVLPAGVAEWKNVVIILAITGIIYGSVIAFRQKDMKRIIAYSSLSHIGLMAAGLFSGYLVALQGTLFMVFAHGIIVTGLFYISDIIEKQTGTRMIDQLGGIRNHAPVLAGFFMIIMLGSIGLPLTNGFIGEFLIFTGLFQYKLIFAALAGITIISGAVYLLNMYQKTMLGNENKLTASIIEIGTSEKIVLFILSAIIIITGLFPQLILDIGSSAVHGIVELTSGSL
ncbi:MAG: NADH-quinone oxidoreductase subunit M [Bacteroidia bacterium]|nr:NADH-quinone oxidoreductase subunit M [Bacteroidia bacterium]